MGIRELVGSTAEAVKRNAPDATPVKNACAYGAAAFTKIAEPVKSACTNSYNCGSAAVAKIDRAVGTIRLRRRTAGDETHGTSVEEVEELDGENATLAPEKTNTCSYGGAAFAKIGEAVATPVKRVCRNSCSYGFVTFAKIGYTVRVKGVYRIVRWMSDDGTKSIIGIYATDFAHESEDGSKFITETVQGVGMPVKNECRNFYTIDFMTFARIGYVVRVNGLYKTGQWMADADIKSRLIMFTNILARNARKHAPGHGNKLFIPGKAAFFIILCRTLIDVVNEEMVGKGAKSVSNYGHDVFPAAYESLKDKVGVHAMREILVFMVKEFSAFLRKEPFLTRFLSKGVLTVDSLVFMMREFFLYMMKQLFGDKFFSGIDEVVVAVLREVFGIEFFNELGFHGQQRMGGR